MDIEKNVQQLNEKLGQNCLLVAVSKTKSADDIMAAYNAGIRDFGENNVLELTEKAEKLPKDIKWHMIGHMQSNKIKHIAPYIHLIHSVDSLKLLNDINKRAMNVDRMIGCLLQVHIAEEETKFGFTEEALFEALQTDGIEKLSNVKIEGIMGMATFTKDMDQVRQEFQKLKTIFDKAKSMYKLDNIDINVLSMGMSGDYSIAVEEGSTMVRVGSAIFGAKYT